MFLNKNIATKETTPPTETSPLYLGEGYELTEILLGLESAVNDTTYRMMLCEYKCVLTEDTVLYEAGLVDYFKRIWQFLVDTWNNKIKPFFVRVWDKVANVFRSYAQVAERYKDADFKEVKVKGYHNVGVFKLSMNSLEGASSKFNAASKADEYSVASFIKMATGRDSIAELVKSVVGEEKEETVTPAAAKGYLNSLKEANAKIAEMKKHNEVVNKAFESAIAAAKEGQSAASSQDEEKIKDLKVKVAAAKNAATAASQIVNAEIQIVIKHYNSLKKFVAASAGAKAPKAAEPAKTEPAKTEDAEPISESKDSDADDMPAEGDDSSEEPMTESVLDQFSF